MQTKINLFQICEIPDASRRPGLILRDWSGWGQSSIRGQCLCTGKKNWFLTDFITAAGRQVIFINLCTGTSCLHFFEIGVGDFLLMTNVIWKLSLTFLSLSLSLSLSLFQRLYAFDQACDFNVTFSIVLDNHCCVVVVVNAYNEYDVEEEKETSESSRTSRWNVTTLQFTSWRVLKEKSNS